MGCGRSPALCDGGFCHAQLDARGEGVVFGTLAGAVRLALPGLDAPRTLRARGPRMMVGWSADGQAAWASDPEGVEVWSLEGESILRLPAVEPRAVLAPVLDPAGTLRLIDTTGLLAVRRAPETFRHLHQGRGATTCSRAGEALWCHSGGKLLAVAPGRPVSEVPLAFPEGASAGLWSLCVHGETVAATNGAALLALGAMVTDSANLQEIGLEPTVIFRGATKRPARQ